ncbi:MAG: hypothetical protein J5659_04610 [Clostridia bacterium]|nr:hypothetical protein [Clostridia bacterium]
MKPGGVVSLKRINSFSFIFKNKLYLLMCLSMVAGVITGSLSLAGNGSAKSLFSYLFNYYINTRQDVGFFKVFISSFFYYTQAGIFFFIIGTSIVGVILSPLLCCVLGIYFSGIAAFAYNKYALKGIAFNAIILVPVVVFVFVFAFVAAKEAFCFSNVIIRITLPKSRPANISGEFKIYSGKFIIVLLLCILAAIIDAAVSVSFLRYFSF